jgi:hypothetical protein
MARERISVRASKDILLVNGAKLKGYSDEGSTQDLEISAGKIVKGTTALPLTYTIEAAGGHADTNIFIAPRACVVKAIKEVHSVANGSSMTAVISKCEGTDAPGSGTSLLAGGSSFDLAATANTVQTATLAGVTTLTLAAGDRLAYEPSAAGSAIAGMNVTIDLEYIIG